MVWFYGGGWTTGHGGISQFGPDYLLEHDIVFVSGNYRLGALGFLSTEDKECSGNFGLKDQVMMLKWVRTNIDEFGGDSNSVTIFGNSVGMLLRRQYPILDPFNAKYLYFRWSICKLSYDVSDVEWIVSSRYFSIRNPFKFLVRFTFETQFILI